MSLNYTQNAKGGLAFNKNKKICAQDIKVVILVSYQVEIYFPGEGNGNPTLICLTGKFHGQRSLAGYSPKGLQRVKHDWA